MELIMKKINGTQKIFPLTGEKLIHAAIKDEKYTALTVIDNNSSRELFAFSQERKNISDTEISSIEIKFDENTKIEFSLQEYNVEYVIGYKTSVTEYLKITIK